MNPGPAPAPPTDRAPRLNLTPAINNIPGNLSAMSLNSGGSYGGSSTSLSRLNEKDQAGVFGVVKEGWARIKEEGFMRGVFWTEKWLVLRDNQLDFHKGTNSPKISFSIILKDVTAVGRSENNSFSFEITRLTTSGSSRETASLKTVICRVETDDEVYSWIDCIYERSPGMGGVSHPTSFSHQVHVGYDPKSGGFTGLPPEWDKLLNNSALTKEDYSKNPTAVIEVLKYYTDKMVNNSEGNTSSYNGPAYSGSAANQYTDPGSANKQLAWNGATNVAPPRSKPSNDYMRANDSYENSRRNQSPTDQITPINDSPSTPSPYEPMSGQGEPGVDYERRRKLEEDARREQARREQKENERREREGQPAYSAAAAKARATAAKQEAGGSQQQDTSSRYQPARAAPALPPPKDRQQPSASLRQPRQDAPNNMQIPPIPPYTGPSGRSDSGNRQPSPGKQLQSNGSSSKNPVVPQNQDAVRQAAANTTQVAAVNSAPKQVNVTVKQPTGAAAVAEAAKALEAGTPVKQSSRRDVRMSAMTEAEVMVRLREVVSREPPLLSYNKQKKIGQGASGSVYVARVLANPVSAVARNILKVQGPRAQVAIKQMDLRNQPRKELIVNEIVVMKESKHPNIVNFVEAFLPEETPELWVVMEFMEGGPLTDVIDNNPSISEDQIATICFEVSVSLLHC